MGIVEQLGEVLKNEEYIGTDNNNLEEALDLYHDLIRENILIPRENQLILDTVEFSRDSNFFQLF
mgnify:CR=1 FL=1